MALGSWSNQLPLFTTPDTATTRQTEYIDLPLSPPSTRKVAWPGFSHPPSPNGSDSAGDALQPKPAPAHQPLPSASSLTGKATNASNGPSGSTPFITWRLGPGSLLLNGRNRNSARLHQSGTNTAPSPNCASPDAPQATDNTHVSMNHTTTPPGPQRPKQQQHLSTPPPTRQHSQNQTPSSTQQQPSTFLRALRPIKTAPLPNITTASTLPSAIVEAMQQTSSDASRLSPLSLGQLFSTPTFQEDQDLASCLSMADLAETPFAFAKALATSEHARTDAQHMPYRPLFRPIRPPPVPTDQPPLELPGPLPLRIQHPDEIAPLLPSESPWHKYTSNQLLQHQHQHQQRQRQQQQQECRQSSPPQGAAQPEPSAAPIFIPMAQVSRQSGSFPRPPQLEATAQLPATSSQAEAADAAPAKLQRCLAQLFSATRRSRNPPLEPGAQQEQQQQQQQQQQRAASCLARVQSPGLPQPGAAVVDAPQSAEPPAAGTANAACSLQAQAEPSSATWTEGALQESEARGWVRGVIGLETIIGVTGPPRAQDSLDEPPTAPMPEAAAVASVAKPRSKRTAAKMLEQQRQQRQQRQQGGAGAARWGAAGEEAAQGNGSPEGGAAPRAASRSNKRQATAPGCLNCGAQQTPQWRCGPDGPRTLCNACGVRYKKGLPLVPR